jgi:hypothetical protein
MARMSWSYRTLYQHYIIVFCIRTTELKTNRSTVYILREQTQKVSVMNL